MGANTVTPWVTARLTRRAGPMRLPDGVKVEVKVNVAATIFAVVALLKLFI
jgi:hypothetical protein